MSDPKNHHFLARFHLRACAQIHPGFEKGE
jgi:hypothetical protein